MNNYTENDLRKLLKDDVVRVSFKKVNGEDRTMICTTNEAIVSQWAPETPVKEAKTCREGLFRVFDLEKIEWRSFKMESVYQVEL